MEAASLADSPAPVGAFSMMNGDGERR